MTKTGFVWHEIYMWHDTGTYAGFIRPSLTVQPHTHYESAESKRRVKNLLEVSGVLEHLHPINAIELTRADLLRVHTERYIDEVLSNRNKDGNIDSESPFGAASTDIALKSAGGAVAAVKAVVSGEVHNAYALVRPPGHHAEPDSGGGFCILANGALAGAYAMDVLGLKKVAFVDWDVHHGNGTETCFIDNPNALTISLHQEALFPFNRGGFEDIGTGAGVGKNINIPLPPGCGHDAYMYAFDTIVLPALQAFEPELIIVLCGFDSSFEDPLGRMLLHSDSYRELTQKMINAAQVLCAGRLVLLHEGGYNPNTTPFLGLAVVETLSGQKSNVVDPNLHIQASAKGQALQAHQKIGIDEIADFHRQQKGSPLHAGT